MFFYRKKLHFSRPVVCCSGELFDNLSEESHSVAICGGSIGRLTGLLIFFSKLHRRHIYREDVHAFSKYYWCR